MSFWSTTSIHNTMKIKAMDMKWQERKKDPFMPKKENSGISDDIARLRQQVEDTKKSSSLMAIDAKLKAGMELTDKEVQYLKENSPELYEEYMEIKRERAEYKEKLRQCKTKEEVQRLNDSKMNEFFSTTKAISSNANIPSAEKKAQLEKIQRRMMAIMNEHFKFLSSDQYAKLPTEEEIDEEKKKKTEKAPQITLEKKELKFFEIDDPEDALEWLKELANSWGFFHSDNTDSKETKKTPAEGAKTSPTPADIDVNDSPVKVYSSGGAVKVISPKTEPPLLKTRG